MSRISCQKLYHQDEYIVIFLNKTSGCSSLCLKTVHVGQLLIKNYNFTGSVDVPGSSLLVMSGGMDDFGCGWLTPYQERRTARRFSFPILTLSTRYVAE